MFQVQRLLQWLVLALVCVSGLLLGVAQSDMTLTIIAIVGSVSAFIITDRLGWIQIDGFIANIAAIIATAYAIVNFAGGSVAQQLISVANLLVYLQIVLLFERKTPRLYWQVLVLSVLQVVVTSAFNLDFKGGLLFIGYMVLAGCTMMVLRLFHDSWQIEQSNKPRRKEIEKSRNVPSTKALGPIGVFENKSSTNILIGSMLRHACWIGICGLLFTMSLFYCVKRGNSSWTGSDEQIAGRTGFTKKIDLDQRGRIRLSQRSVFKAKFHVPDDQQPVRLSHEALMRGISMSKLVINGANQTTWEPNYGAVTDSSYRSVQSIPRGVRHLVQDIKMEQSKDPLIHAAYPAYRTDSTPKVITFLHPLQALTRGKEGEVIGGTQYEYSFLVPIQNNDTLASVVSHRYFEGSGYQLSENTNDPQTSVLLEIDKSRYPQLVSLADQIASNSSFANPFNVMRTMEEFFLNSDEFKYTLDFTNVPRDLTIDPVEDFISNHKVGHCEYYASALTLMLRSQGIPSRVVVGFKGGDYDEADGFYHFKEKHAHAWVEAYVYPNQLVRGLRGNRDFANSGAWVTLDPTPGTVEEYEDDIVDQASSFFDAANNYWNEFVVGRTSEHDDDFFDRSGSDSGALLNLDYWASQVGLSDSYESNPGFNIIQVIAPLFIVFLFGWAWYSNYRKNLQDNEDRQENVSFWRRVIASAVSIVMPKVGKWIIESGSSKTTSIHFYRRFMKMMNKYGLEREPSQTHREFAAEANEHFNSLAAIAEIKPLINQITEVFYHARFAGPALDNNQSQSIEQSVSKLENLLAKTAVGANTA